MANGGTPTAANRPPVNEPGATPRPAVQGAQNTPITTRAQAQQAAAQIRQSRTTARRDRTGIPQTEAYVESRQPPAPQPRPVESANVSEQAVNTEAQLSDRDREQRDRQRKQDMNRMRIEAQSDVSMYKEANKPAPKVAGRENQEKTGARLEAGEQRKRAQSFQQGQNMQRAAALARSAARQKGGQAAQKPKPKIPIMSALLIFTLAAILDTIGFILLYFALDDYWLLDIIFTPITQLYLRFKGARAGYDLVASLVEFVPYVGALPIKTIGIIVVIFADRNQKAKQVVQAAKQVKRPGGKATTIRAGGGAGAASSKAAGAAVKAAGAAK